MLANRTDINPRRAVHRIVAMLLFVSMVVYLPACQSPAVEPSKAPAPATSENGEKFVLLLPDPATFDELSDEELETVIIDIADAQVSNNDENPYLALTKLPYGYQVVYVTWRVESEVNNGGFYQYFHDTDAKFTFLAQKALKLIDAPKTADLLSRAMLQVEEKMPELLDPDRGKQAFNDKVIIDKNPLVNLDNEFFDGSENLSALRLDYIRRHLSQFEAGARPASP